jgi:hypothetical protein
MTSALSSMPRAAAAGSWKAEAVVPSALQRAYRGTDGGALELGPLEGDVPLALELPLFGIDGELLAPLLAPPLQLLLRDPVAPLDVLPLVPVPVPDGRVSDGAPCALEVLDPACARLRVPGLEPALELLVLALLPDTPLGREAP